MNSVCSLMLFCSLVHVVFVSHSESTEIDWKTEYTRVCILFGIEYSSHHMAQLLRDSFTVGFMFISPDDLIEGNFEDLAKSVEARSKLGHWEDGRPQIVATCDNTALIWTKIIFTDGKNYTREGYETILLEFVDNKAKNKLVQLTA